MLQSFKRFCGACLSQMDIHNRKWDPAFSIKQGIATIDDAQSSRTQLRLSDNLITKKRFGQCS